VGSESNNRDLLFSYATPFGENFHAGVSFVRSYYNMPSQNNVTIGDPCNIIFLDPFSSAISQTTNEERIFVGGNLSGKTSLDLSMYFANVDYHVPDPNVAIPCLFSPVGNYLQIEAGQPPAYIDTRYSYAAPRLGFVWRPSPAVSVRAAAGGGFAEAPLSDLVGSNGTPFCLGGSCSVTLTNTSLQPEKSFSFDLGTDIRLHRNTVFSLDVYRSNLYGQLYHSTSFTGTCPTCGGLPLYITQYGNLGVSRYEGVLIDLRHDAPRGVYWALSGGLIRGYLVSVPNGFYGNASGPCDFATAKTPNGSRCPNLAVVPNVNFNGAFTGVNVPYSQALGKLGYRWSAEKYADLVGTYYGNNNTYNRPAFVELDGHVGYSLSRNLSLLMTFQNITGIYDGSIQTFAAENLSAAPVVAGLPYALYGEEFGPRTVLLTAQLHL
jgi:outer membrane receptor protein involved in Fe transport